MLNKYWLYFIDFRVYNTVILPGDSLVFCSSSLLCKVHLSVLAGGSVAVSSCKPQGCGFNSWCSWHIPRLQAWSLVRPHTGGSQSICLSHISVSLPLSLNPFPLNKQKSTPFCSAHSKLKWPYLAPQICLSCFFLTVVRNLHSDVIHTNLSKGSKIKDCNESLFFFIWYNLYYMCCMIWNLNENRKDKTLKYDQILIHDVFR